MIYIQKKIESFVSFILVVVTVFIFLIIIRVDYGLPVPSHVILLPLYTGLLGSTISTASKTFNSRSCSTAFSNMLLLLYYVLFLIGTVLFGLRVDNTIRGNWFIVCIPFWVHFPIIIIVVIQAALHREENRNELNKPLAFSLLFVYVLLMTINAELVPNQGEHFFWVPTLFPIGILIYIIKTSMRDYEDYISRYMLYSVPRENCKYCKNYGLILSTENFTDRENVIIPMEEN